MWGNRQNVEDDPDPCPVEIISLVYGPRHQIRQPVMVVNGAT